MLLFVATIIGGLTSCPEPANRCNADSDCPINEACRLGSCAVVTGEGEGEG